MCYKFVDSEFLFDDLGFAGYLCFVCVGFMLLLWICCLVVLCLCWCVLL